MLRFLSILVLALAAVLPMFYTSEAPSVAVCEEGLTRQCGCIRNYASTGHRCNIKCEEGVNFCCAKCVNCEGGSPMCQCKGGCSLLLPHPDPNVKVTDTQFSIHTSNASDPGPGPGPNHTDTVMPRTLTLTMDPSPLSLPTPNDHRLRVNPQPMLGQVPFTSSWSNPPAGSRARRPVTSTTPLPLTLRSNGDYIEYEESSEDLDLPTPSGPLEQAIVNQLNTNLNSPSPTPSFGTHPAFQIPANFSKVQGQPRPRDTTTLPPTTSTTVTSYNVNANVNVNRNTMQVNNPNPSIPYTNGFNRFITLKPKQSPRQNASESVNGTSPYATAINYKLPLSFSFGHFPSAASPTKTVPTTTTKTTTATPPTSTSRSSAPRNKVRAKARNTTTPMPPPISTPSQYNVKVKVNVTHEPLSDQTPRRCDAPRVFLIKRGNLPPYYKTFPARHTPGCIGDLDPQASDLVHNVTVNVNVTRNNSNASSNVKVNGNRTRPPSTLSFRTYNPKAKRPLLQGRVPYTIPSNLTKTITSGRSPSKVRRPLTKSAPRPVYRPTTPFNIFNTTESTTQSPSTSSTTVFPVTSTLQEASHRGQIQGHGEVLPATESPWRPVSGFHALRLNPRIRTTSTTTPSPNSESESEY